MTNTYPNGATVVRAFFLVVDTDDSSNPKAGLLSGDFTSIKPQVINGQVLDPAGAALSLTHGVASTASLSAGSVIDHGDGRYSVDLTVAASDDGVQAVVVMVAANHKVYPALMMRNQTHVDSIATDAVDAASIKADAVTEIQSGLATSSAIGTPTAIGGPGSATIADMLYQMAGGGSFDFSLHSLRGLYVTGQANWITATGWPSAASIASEVAGDLASNFAAVNAGVTTAKNEVLAALTDGTVQIDPDVYYSMLPDGATGTIGAAFELVHDYLDAAISSVGGGGGGGEGIYTLTVTVEDSDGAVQGARVALSGTNYSLTSDSNGQAVFNVDTGVYSLVTSPPSGYQTPDNVAKTITGNDTATITLAEETAGDPSEVGWIG